MTLLSTNNRTVVWILIFTFLVSIFVSVLAFGQKTVESATQEEIQTEIQTEIKKLLSELSQLQAQIAQIKQNAQVPTDFQFVRNLTIGNRGEDVRQLQKILNSNLTTLVALVGAGSIGNETNYFGQLTKDAVKRFQETYFEDVLLPVGLVLGTGFVGPSTRAKLNEISASGNATLTSLFSSGRPTVSGVIPDTGLNGTTIVISGSNFDKTNNIVGVGGTILNNVPSHDGKTITIVLNSTEYAQMFGGTNGTVKEKTLLADQNVALLTEGDRNSIIDGFSNGTPAQEAEFAKLVDKLPESFKPYFARPTGTIPLGITVSTQVGISNKTVLFNLKLLP